MVTKCPLCWVEEHAGNPGSSEEKEPIWTSVTTVAEALAEKGAVTDALWDLRSEILKALKELKLVASDVTGPEVQGYIDGLILKLVHQV